jgi:hypothetical protein
MFGFTKCFSLAPEEDWAREIFSDIIALGHEPWKGPESVTETATGCTCNWHGLSKSLRRLNCTLSLLGNCTPWHSGSTCIVVYGICRTLYALIDSLRAAKNGRIRLLCLPGFPSRFLFRSCGKERTSSFEILGSATQSERRSNSCHWKRGHRCRARSKYVLPLFLVVAPVPVNTTDKAGCASLFGNSRYLTLETSD